jgi:hypothetical protein
MGFILLPSNRVDLFRVSVKIHITRKLVIATFGASVTCVLSILSFLMHFSMLIIGSQIPPSRYWYNTNRSDWHKFRLDANTGQLISPSNQWSSYWLNGAPESCLSYKSTFGSSIHDGYHEHQYVGGIYPIVCSRGGNDIQNFIFSGGAFTSAQPQDWIVISEGNLPWISEFSRNALNHKISSSYEDGDMSKYFTEVQFYDNSVPYYEYKIEFPGMRNPASSTVHFAELELPGLVIGQSNISPTSNPTTKPTKKPTRRPTSKPTRMPTRRPTSGDFVINKKKRCGASEIDARETCSMVCNMDKDCPTVLGRKHRCYSVYANYCDSIPKRTYTSPSISRVSRRCGLSEIYARTFCTQACSQNSDCTGAGEACLEVFDNYCGSLFTEN